MKRKITLLTGLLVLATGIYLSAADHNEAPAISGLGTDIADLFAFESPSNSNYMVLAATVNGLLSPNSTANARFDEDIMVEFNIDNNGDNTEDLVIQCTFENNKVQMYGPYAPALPGTTSTIDGTASFTEGDITPYGSNAIIERNGSISLFAGPRDDPFFFDLNQFDAILDGNATSFNNPGDDSLKGTNVLAVVAELPKSMLGSGESINVWVETKRKQ